MSALITIAAIFLVCITLLLVGIAPIVASRYNNDPDETLPSGSCQSG